MVASLWFGIGFGFGAVVVMAVEMLVTRDKYRKR